jgi:hypothetical protein
MKGDMDTSKKRHYRLISAFLPDNLEARFADLQRDLFRNLNITWAQALPPFVPLRWCRDGAERLSKLLTHSEKPDASFLPATTGAWIAQPESVGPGSRMAAALNLEPGAGIGRMVQFFVDRTEPGPALFQGGLGSLVLALAPAQAAGGPTENRRSAGVVAPEPPRPAAPPRRIAPLPSPASAPIPAPERITTKVLRLGLLDLEDHGQGITWQMYELAWLARRKGG